MFAFHYCDDPHRGKQGRIVATPPERGVISLDDLKQSGRGLLMGGADIIPGVSGGTVALILGIYQRLVTAISRVDLTLLGFVRQRRWREAAAHVDLRFLIFLGAGIATGIGGLASLMHFLLEYHPQPTAAAFFGLIAASSILVGRMIPRWAAIEVTALITGAGAAFLIVGLPFTSSPPSGNGYLFLCGMIAICAMILPGISGAFILLILGKYTDITGMLKQVLHFSAGGDVFLSLVIFAAGCVTGLIGFSKLLKWMLERHETPMLALLCGFMAGSLRKIWPFKRDLTPGVDDLKLKRFANVWPNEWTGEVWLAIGLAAAAFVFVMILDALTAGHEHPTHGESGGE